MSKTYTVYTLESSDGKMYVGTTSTTLRERWNNGNGYRFIEELWHSIETCRRVGLAKEKAVVQLTTGGKLIAVWDSGKQASLATGTQAGHISKVCKHQRKTAGGFAWAYAN